jgi:creatinine amidohydrolase/Fe(II)-dependent formamide hydrolase-like protein
VLQEIDCLEVGPVEVERRRLRCTYRIIRNGALSRANLIYKYEEDMFERDDPVSVNLASMVTAQVALNYGLFCREIEFHGSFDAADRRFLEDFAANTAREIYVNKFLMPNVFLTGPASELPVVRQESYLSARLSFPGAVEAESNGLKAGTPEHPWLVDRSRHAVLSSGGKDSLLTYGLLDELEREPHAVFVNESGRHWYTAMNAYRHLQKSGESTARVWTNSDRVYSWVLRQLPFVRKDFARVRSDIYPIQLWTLPVFLFGALPVLRTKGIGRLLVGDEYDTTQRLRHSGVTHYGGLFDQSRYFDNALTRYFRRKGWGIQLFSILRPLSEMLIEKVLVERYPKLQRHQMSCHATHLSNGRAYPCGKCEKCRRIVGMMAALDADWRRCGYTDEQAGRCLGELIAKGVHQESEGAEHLASLLVEKGLVPAGGSKIFRARSHPEILSLRFHPERSPFDAIPADLREGVYRILLEHADGALERQGKGWSPCDPLSQELLTMPYPLDSPSGQPLDGASKESTRTGLKGSFHLGQLTWPEAKRRFAEVDVALLPVGAIEQHGPHLPLDTDAFDAGHLADRVASRCDDPKPLVLPLIPYGVSYHHEDFSGTLSVSPETQARLVYEIGVCAARNGVKKLVIINGHGGNSPALHLAAQMINKDAHIFTCVDTGETSDPDIGNLIETPNDVHAGEIETSTSLATRPELVFMEKAPRMIPRFSSRYLDFTSRRSVGWYARTAKISRSGVMGDATKASGEKGKKIWDLMTGRLVELVEDLKRLSLDEIFQKRY